MFRGLKSLITGIVAGTALGVLFAPDKGDKTRKKIHKEVKGGGSGLSSVKEALNNMGDDIKDVYGEVNENEKVKKGKATIKEYVEIAMDKSDTWIKNNVPAEKRRKVKTAIKDAKKRIKSARRTATKTAKKAQKSVDKLKKRVNKRKK